MKVKWLLAATLAMIVIQTTWSAQAFECTTHFATAQAAIDKVAADLKADLPWKRLEDKALVHALRRARPQCDRGARRRPEARSRAGVRRGAVRGREGFGGTGQGAPDYGTKCVLSVPMWSL